MRFRFWDINNEKYCKNFSEIADRISFVTAFEGSKFAGFTVNMAEFVTEFDTECMDKYHDPIFDNDRVKYKDEEYIVICENGTHVLYDRNGDTTEYVLSEVAEECEIIGTVHDVTPKGEVTNEEEK